MAYEPFKSEDLSISTPELSSGGAGLIESAYQRSLTEPKTEVPIAKNPSPESISRGQAILGSSDESLARALAQRTGRAYAEGTAPLKNAQGLMGFEKNFRNQQQAFTYMEAAERVKSRNAKMKFDVYRANQEARAAALRSILGVAGMAAGAAIAGPAGAGIAAQAMNTASPQQPQGPYGSQPLTMPSRNYGDDLSRQFRQGNLAADTDYYQSSRGPRANPLKDSEF